MLQGAANSSAVAEKEPETALSEVALASLLRKGHAAAFRLVIQRHNRRLYRVARSILHDDAEAEDAVQEAYVKALTNLEGFREQASLSTWLTRIVINEALGRRRARRPSIRFNVVDEMFASGQEIMSPAIRRLLDDGPERAAARGELRVLIERAVDDLPDSFRMVFVLRAVEGLSVEETASHLGIPAATVKTRFHRARRLLQDALDEMVAGVLTEAFPFGGDRCERMTENVLARISIGSERDRAKQASCLDRIKTL